MDNNDLISTEVWRDVPIDTLYHYQASTLGRIRKVMPDGKYIILKPTRDDKSYSITVTLRLPNNGRVRKCVITIIGETFLGRKEGYRFHVKNGIKTDTRLCNIGYATASEISRMANKSKRKTIFKIDKQGNVVEIYTDTRDCARKSFFSQQAIASRCAGNRKSIFANDGYAYCYEDNTKYMKEIYKHIGVEMPC